MGSEQSILLAFLCSLQAVDSAKEEASEEAEVEVPDDLTDPLLEAEVAEEAARVVKLSNSAAAAIVFLLDST